MKTLLIIGYIILIFLFYYVGERVQKIRFEQRSLGIQQRQFKNLMRRVQQQIEENKLKRLLDPATRKELEELSI